MTDTVDERFEHDLRAVLAGLAPADAPAAVRFAVADIATRRPRRRLPFGLPWRPLLAMTGVIVAAVLLVAVGAGLPRLLAGPWTVPAVGGPLASPTFPTSIHGVWINFAPAHRLTPAEQRAVSQVLMDRMLAFGVDMETSSVQGEGFDRITANIGLVDGDQESIDELRALLGTTGRIDFVPLGGGSAERGDVIDMERFPPLLSGEQVAGAALGRDQSGSPTVEFVLTPEGRSLLADYTAGHVGESFAITLDGVAISVPTIQAAIPDGRVEVSVATGVDELPAIRRLVAIVASGPLPVALEEISTVLR